MTGKRSYNDVCGVARALDAVGERWTLMIVRELLLGPKRFTDIRAGLPGLSADVLTQRLRELGATGLVRKATLPPPSAAKVYELTPSGAALEPVIHALGRWGGANAAPPAEGLGMSLDSHIISFRTLFDPERAEGFDANVEFRLGDHRFRAVVADAELTVERGGALAPDAVLTTDPTTLIDVAHGRREFGVAVASGELEIDGSEQVAEQFLGLFPLPQPAAPTAA